jgi:UDP-N-acetylglucosamine acyltransferase
MKATIHPTACVDASAKLGEDVIIGPYAIVGKDAIVGDRTEIYAHAVVGSGTILGTDNEIHYGAVLGDKPQDISYKNESSNVIIGNNNKIREYVTIHKATGEGKSTVIGDNCFLMSFVHLAHNCKVGNNVVIVSMTHCAGHVVIEDNATIGGMVAIPQFLKVGKLAMVGGYSRLFQDVPPFMLAEGNPAKVHAINAVGIKRNPQIVAKKVAPIIKEAYKILYRQHNNVAHAVDKIRKKCVVDGVVPSEIQHLITFIENAKKGISGSAAKPGLLLQREESGLMETQPFFEKMRTALSRKK